MIARFQRSLDEHVGALLCALGQHDYVAAGTRYFSEWRCRQYLCFRCGLKESRMENMLEAGQWTKHPSA